MTPQVRSNASLFTSGHHLLQVEKIRLKIRWSGWSKVDDTTWIVVGILLSTFPSIWWSCVKPRSPEITISLHTFPFHDLPLITVPYLVSGGTCTCHYCGLSFSGRKRLTEHFKKHDGKTKCLVCQKTFGTVSILRRHMLVQHKMTKQKVNSITEKRPYMRIFDWWRRRHYFEFDPSGLNWLRCRLWYVLCTAYHNLPSFFLFLLMLDAFLQRLWLCSVVSSLVKVIEERCVWPLQNEEGLKMA